jgi:DNA invertase Pin-like site-specific DNA recombinase
MNTTVNEQHLSKTAYVYVRQSTLAQVRHHQESTERQYALRSKALDMGWSEPSVQILERELGK